jgi:hypothetical protein
MLFAVDLDEDFIDVKGVSVTSMFSLQSPGIQRAELDTPKAGSFSGYGDAPFSKEVFYISVAEIEVIVEPDSV